LVDSHCHLDFPEFESEQIEIISRAAEQGIGCMVTVSTKIQNLDRILAVAKRFPSVYCSVGTHPHYASEPWERALTIEQIISAATSYPKIVAIGESGLDFHYNKSTPDDQYASFRKHISAARETGLPLIIHSREAEEGTLDILREEMKKGTFNAILHCFSSKRILAESAIELGCYISFSGILTFNASDELREIVRDLPLNRLLVETDAPYLAPIPHRGQRNEPSYLPHISACLANIKGLSHEEMAKITTENFLRLFDRIKLG
ncbi:MAG: TatD family hydrolase, partial [Alphaproteobacteria bacterium]|nr:TatD family hydrolase [Alphaproteobacteria bacterium]